eukprot:gene5001-5658_t
MAMVVKHVFFIALLLIISFRVRKPAFVSGGSLYSSPSDEYLNKHCETYIFSSLWQTRVGRYNLAVKCSKSTFFSLLLLMCGDVHPCPGPSQNNRFNPELAKLTSKKGVKILHHNVRGFSSNFDHVVEMLKSFPNMDILSLSETHFQQGRVDENPEALYAIPGFSFVNKPRKSGKGGGVAAYISDKITYNQRFDLEKEEIECIWLEIKPLKSSPYLTGIIYRPPNSSKHLSTNFNNSFDEMLKNSCKSSLETILLGDVNYLVSGDGKDFKSIISSNGLKQIIRKAPESATPQKLLLTSLQRTDLRQ